MILLVIIILVSITIDAWLKVISFMSMYSRYTSSAYLKFIGAQIVINIIELFSIALLIVQLG